MQQQKGFNISAKTFIAALAVVAVLMVLCYSLTFFIPAGEYQRITDAGGSVIIDAESGFNYTEGSLPFWKFILSPFLVLGADGGFMIAAILVFLIIIGGIFNSLEVCGLMRYMLSKIVDRFSARRYALMKVITLFFMAMGALIGSFEECVPLVPIVVALAVSLGWDRMTGMGMSLLAVGCGFASGLLNPFTVGVAQNLAGIPMFSGIWLRAVAFVLIYILLIFFLTRHAKKIDNGAKLSENEFVYNEKYEKALRLFACILGSGILIVLCSGFIPFLQDYTMIIVAVMFLAAGLTSTLASGMKGKELMRSFIKGVISILPAILLILMASSIKYILTEASILDTIIFYCVELLSGMPQWAIVLFIYLIVLILNFFISSGSAKAFLLIPLIVPIAQMFGIEPQLCVLAFAFGDGFSNVFYPTNAALLISLGLADISYGKWIRYSWKFQLTNLVLTSLILLLGLWAGYC